MLKEAGLKADGWRAADQVRASPEQGEPGHGYSGRGFGRLQSRYKGSLTPVSPPDRGV